MGSYDYFKSLLLKHRVPVIDYQFRDSLGLHVVASFLAGTIATSASLLADIGMATRADNLLLSSDLLSCGRYEITFNVICKWNYCAFESYD